MSDPITNIKRFAVVHKRHGVIALVAPDEDFCKKYCGRENMAFGYEAYHVVPHDEPMKVYKPQPNGVYHAPTQPELITNTPVKTEPQKPKDIKSRVAEYLQKTS